MTVRWHSVSADRARDSSGKRKNQAGIRIDAGVARRTVSGACSRLRFPCALAKSAMLMALRHSSPGVPCSWHCISRGRFGVCERAVCAERGMCRKCLYLQCLRCPCANGLSRRGVAVRVVGIIGSVDSSWLESVGRGGGSDRERAGFSFGDDRLPLCAGDECDEGSDGSRRRFGRIEIMVMGQRVGARCNGLGRGWYGLSVACVDGQRADAFLEPVTHDAEAERIVDHGVHCVAHGFTWFGLGGDLLLVEDSGSEDFGHAIGRRGQVAEYESLGWMFKDAIGRVHVVAGWIEVESEGGPVFCPAGVDVGELGERDCA